MAFPCLITIVDCQRTYPVVGLPDLLLPTSNLIGFEKLSAWACSPCSSSPPDAGESSDSTDPWSHATRRCSSRQLKQKLCPSFIIWTLPMITLGEFVSSRCPVWCSRGSSSDCSSHLQVLSRIYRLGEKSRVVEFFEMNMRWDAIWCILRPNFEKCYSGILFYFLVVITLWMIFPI